MQQDRPENTLKAIHLDLDQDAEELEFGVWNLKSYCWKLGGPEV
jgi:hypothetical protein